MNRCAAVYISMRTNNNNILRQCRVPDEPLCSKDVLHYHYGAMTWKPVYRDSTCFYYLHTLITS